MAQPPAYNRTKDFTVDFQNETDHTALNAEFDDAANSINDIRNNLSILQADDGRLRPAVVTPESIDSAIVDNIISRLAGEDISRDVLSRAEFFADTAKQQADIAREQADIATEKAIHLVSFFDSIFPIGSIYQSFVNAPPGFGTWTLLSQGVVLLSAGDDYVAGTTYGKDTHQMASNEMPSHNHTVTISATGGHTHTRGTMEIEGGTAFNAHNDQTTYPVSGAFYQGGTKKNLGWGSAATYHELAFKASRSWTGETSSEGEHSHTATVTMTGGNKSFSLMQKSVAVYIFRRTA